MEVDFCLKAAEEVRAKGTNSKLARFERTILRRTVMKYNLATAMFSLLAAVVTAQV